MSSTPVTNRPAARTPTAASSQRAKTEPKAAPPSPTKPGSSAEEYRKQREASEFQRAVATLPAPGPAHDDVLSSRGARTLESVQKLLSGVVTDGNAREALAALSSLEPRDFKLVMDKLGRSGALATLLHNLPEGGRSQFLAMGAQKGWLQAEPGKQPTTTKFDPPASPTLYKMERRLPTCVNDAIYAESKASAAKYRSDFAAYIGRYESAVKATTSKEGLAAIGHPAVPSNDRLNLEPGLAGEAAYRRDFGTDFATRGSAYETVSRQVAKLTGERHDGSAWLEVSLELAQQNGATLEVTANDQRAEAKVGGTASGHAGPVEGRIKRSGNEESVKVGVGPVEGELKAKGGQVTEGTAKVEGPAVAEVGLDREGKATFGLGTKVGGNQTSAEASVVTTASPTTAEMTAGVSGELKVNGNEVKVKVSVGYKGTPRSTTRNLVNGQSVFDH